jgi:hypothetical protein
MGKNWKATPYLFTAGTQAIANNTEHKHDQHLWIMPDRICDSERYTDFCLISPTQSPHAMCSDLKHKPVVLAVRNLITNRKTTFCSVTAETQHALCSDLKQEQIVLAVKDQIINVKAKLYSLTVETQQITYNMHQEHEQPRRTPAFSDLLIRNAMLVFAWYILMHTVYSCTAFRHKT